MVSFGAVYFGIRKAMLETINRENVRLQQAVGLLALAVAATAVLFAYNDGKPVDEYFTMVLSLLFGVSSVSM